MVEKNPELVLWPLVDRQFKAPTIYDTFQYPWRERARANAMFSWPWRPQFNDQTNFDTGTELQLTAASSGVWNDVGSPGPTEREFYVPIPCDFVGLRISTDNAVIPQEGLVDSDEWLEFRFESGIGSGDYSTTLHMTRQSIGAGAYLTRADGTLYRTISGDGTPGTDVRFKVQERHNTNATRKMHLDIGSIVFLRRTDD